MQSNRTAGDQLFLCLRVDSEKHLAAVVGAVGKVEIRGVGGFPSAVGSSASWSFPRSGFFHSSFTHSLCYTTLRRSHIAASQHRYIGKKTCRKWEQGDDLSLVDFQCAEYSDGKTVADEELRRRIVEFGIRKTGRATNTDSKTIMLIAKGERDLQF